MYPFGIFVHHLRIMDKPHAGLLRRGRVSENGRAYHVTAACIDRRRVFADFQSARCVVRAMRECDRLGACITLAFVVMPDHLHWLFILEDDSLSRLVGRLKTRSAADINRLADRSGQQIWQPGFHDHAARREDDVREIARYIVANPLRAGLVKSPRDYPHWDAIWL